MHEDMPTRPISPYGVTKLAGENYCRAYAKSYGLSTVALRFSNVYGPYSNKKNSVVAKFIKSAMAKQPLTINGTGAQTRDFIFVKDLVEALIACMNKPLKGFNLFQIASGTETSINDLRDEIATCSVHLGQNVPQSRNSTALVGDVDRNLLIAKSKKST